MNRPDPVRLWHRAPLSVRNRDHGNRSERVENGLVFGQVKPTVERGDERRGLSVEQGERIVIEMKVEEVELLLVAFAADPLQHHHMKRVGIADRAVQAQRFRPGCLEFCRCLRVAAGE